MSDVRKLIKDLNRGVALRKNLQVYGNLLADTYLDYTSVELTFSAYMLAEMVVDDGVVSAAEQEIYNQVMGLLRMLMEKTGDEDRMSVISAVQRVRGQITKIMEGFTSYTDQLIGYDYVIQRKRMHYKPDEEALSKVNSIREDEFVQELMTYLVGDSDQSVVRDRLQMLMGQVPVHMTRQKLLEKVKETLSLYAGSDMASLDAFLYRLRSSAMLHKAKAGVPSGEKIERLIEEFSELDFSHITEETYEAAAERLEEVTKEITVLTDYYYSLQKVVNGIYALALVSEQKIEDSQVSSDCKEILLHVANGGLDDSSLVKLEGKIETCVEKAASLEAILSEVLHDHEDLLGELGLLDAFRDYEKISTLLSDSLFVDFTKTQKYEEVDAEMLKRVYADFSRELTDGLAAMQRPLKKAAMAAVLENLPVDFENMEQIETYIRTNLFGCQDDSERAVVLLELQEMMAEAAEWRKK